MDLFDIAKNGYMIEKNVLEGFRLYKLEVYNWGTFDKNVWTFNMNGETSLLTGDVGSGKSTLVDAISTLLLAPRKINYNKAADATSKERTASTYIRGYYGQQKGKKSALREFDKYSVLLVTFKDELHDETLTLAQFFYFKEANSAPVKFYVVAQKELFIAKEFTDLRKNLKNQNIGVYDSYNDYRERFCNVLGGLSEQALDLFNQTISMKKVDELTYFVRHSMLEEKDVSEDITNLLNHYSYLNSAHEAVLTAKKQIEMLAPISNKGEEYIKAKEKLLKIEKAKEHLSSWIAVQKEPLFEEKIKKITVEVDLLKEKIEIEKNKIEATEENINRTLSEKYQNGGNQIEHLKRELKINIEELGRRKNNLQKYFAETEKLKLPVAKNINIFKENIRKIPEIEKINSDVLEDKNRRKTELSMEINEFEKDKNNIETEIISLEKRKSNIPDNLVKLRDKISRELFVPIKELPFVGELVEVKDSELAWEGAIERLLNSFAISMLVTDENYTKISNWVNKNSLGTKLVYHKITNEKLRVNNVNPLTVYSKIVIKQDSIFKNWLENWIFERFNFLCCDNVESFRKSNKAITKEGQIKSVTRHEKDDRRAITDRTKYVLGFSNDKKIAVFKEQVNNLNVNLDKLNINLKNCHNAINSSNSNILSLNKIKDISDFKEIDIVSVQTQITNYKNQIKEIEATNDIFAKLEEQLVSLQSQKKLQTETKDKLIENKSKLENSLEVAQSKHRENKEKLIDVNDKDFSYIIEIYKKDKLTLNNCDSYERQIENILSKEIKKSTDECSKLEKTIEKLMQSFNFSFKTKSLELDSNINYLSEYKDVYKKLMFDDLPKYEIKFKDMLHSNILRQIAVFQNKLNNSYEKVKTRIDDINQSLNTIDFNKNRYIKIEYSNIADTEIRKFREELRNCTGGLTSNLNNDALIEEKFDNIKGIIERFKGRENYVEVDKRWTKKVTDVRMWFDFLASERFRDTDEEYERYTDSNGKSGGQKEKLAYTILAASLVYNYGIDEKFDESRSFRFVAIDEAFLKSSEESAKYGLELFEKLKFQLLVITPLVKIQTIEPFVSNVGFVSHDDIKHISSVQNIPIEEYKQRRKELKIYE